MSSGGKRHFTIAGSDISISGGLYKSTSPYAAGKKAATELFRKKKSASKVKFILRETTNDSDKKSFYYEATVEHLKTPIETTWKKADGTPVFITKKIHLKTCHGDDLKSLHTPRK